MLTDTLAVIPQIAAEPFEKMMQGSLQDVLMVVYLANLTRTLAERLQSVV